MPPAHHNPAKAAHSLRSVSPREGRSTQAWPSHRHTTLQSWSPGTRRTWFIRSPTSSRCCETRPARPRPGEGVYLWDTDGKQYIDGFAGLWNVNVGHGRHELAVAAAEQIDEVAFVPTFFGLASPPAIDLAAKLAELFPGDLNHIHFTSGGAESNETALKIARYYWYLKGKPDKIKIISRKMGYHGIAMGALAATGIPTYHAGLRPGRAGLRPCLRALRLPQWRGSLPRTSSSPSSCRSSRR